MPSTKQPAAARRQYVQQRQNKDSQALMRDAGERLAYTNRDPKVVKQGLMSDLYTRSVAAHGNKRMRKP